MAIYTSKKSVLALNHVDMVLPLTFHIDRFGTRQHSRCVLGLVENRDDGRRYSGEEHKTLGKKPHIKGKKRLWTRNEEQNGEKTPEKWKQEEKEKRQPKHRRG